MLRVIGEPELVDTSRDSRLSRIFSNKIIKRYQVFDEFYGMEECIEKIVGFSSTQPRAWRRENRYFTCWAL